MSSNEMIKHAANVLATNETTGSFCLLIDGYIKAIGKNMRRSQT